jgi:hypothetical protein
MVTLPIAMEDFSIGKRIFLLVSIHLNTEWIPYFVSRENVLEQKALVLDGHVDLKNDEHLEPS